MRLIFFIFVILFFLPVSLLVHAIHSESHRTYFNGLTESDLEYEWNLLEAFMNSGHTDFSRGFSFIKVRGNTLRPSMKPLILACPSGIKCIVIPLPMSWSPPNSGTCTIQVIGIVKGVDYREKIVKIAAGKYDSELRVLDCH